MHFYFKYDPFVASNILIHLLTERNDIKLDSAHEIHGMT